MHIQDTRTKHPVQEVSHLIEIHNLSRSYPSGDETVQAIKQMAFHIDDGEFVAVMGPSGSGKSTLLSILGGLNQPTSGRVLMDGMDIYRLNREQLADFRSEYIGFIFQSFQLIPYLTILENIQLPMAITATGRKTQKDLAMVVLDRVGLAHKAGRLPDELSGGEQERVAIGRAIVNHPPIILADEPTGNLDSRTSEEILALLARLNQDGHTIIMVTHDDEMARHAGRILQVRDGCCPAAEKGYPSFPEG